MKTSQEFLGLWKSSFPIQDSAQPKLSFTGTRAKIKKKERKHFLTRPHSLRHHTEGKLAAATKTWTWARRSSCTWKMRPEILCSRPQIMGLKGSEAGETSCGTCHALIIAAVGTMPLKPPISSLKHDTLSTTAGDIPERPCDPDEHTGNSQGNRWLGFLNNAIQCRTWRRNVALIMLLKRLFCLDRMNLTILDQVFDKMWR